MGNYQEFPTSREKAVAHHFCIVGMKTTWTCQAWLEKVVIFTGQMEGELRFGVLKAAVVKMKHNKLHETWRNWGTKIVEVP